MNKADDGVARGFATAAVFRDLPLATAKLEQFFIMILTGAKTSSGSI